MYHLRKNRMAFRKTMTFSSYTYVIIILPKDSYINLLLSQQSSYKQPALTLKISLGFGSTLYL
jgi:hypothetical protein